jgi:hypothetical protein
MRKIKIIGLALATLTAATAVSAPASAHPRHHPVCHWEHHHGHKARVCR